MKFRVSFLCVLEIAGLFLFTCKSNAEEMQTCPKNCFCIYDGKLPKRMNMDNVCGYGVAQRMSCSDKNKSVSFAYAGVEGTLSCSRDKQAEYYFDEFSEIYITDHGMYGFLGQEFITMPFFNVAGYGSTVGVYQCPSSYPSSDAGAKTIFNCYKYDETGKKVYYTKGKIQNSQGQATALEAAKVMINENNKDLKLSEGIKKKSDALKIQGMTTGKSLRASGRKQMLGNSKAAVDESTKTSNDNDSDVDLETAKKLISAGI